MVTSELLVDAHLREGYYWVKPAKSSSWQIAAVTTDNGIPRIGANRAADLMKRFPDFQVAGPIPEPS